eukprot:scaffold63380_cov59-Cyclotella_meneghiniana.AAC.4
MEDNNNNNNDNDDQSSSSGILTEHNNFDDLSSSSSLDDGDYDPFDCEDYKLSFDTDATMTGRRNIVDMLMERSCRGGVSSSLKWNWGVAGSLIEENDDMHMTTTSSLQENDESSPACSKTPKSNIDDNDNGTMVNHQLMQAAVLRDAVAHRNLNGATT